LRLARSARALRWLKLVRLTAFVGEASQEARRLFVRHGLQHVLLVTVLVTVGVSGLVLAVEETADGSIGDFGDALWWAISTVTTVGYGDTVPTTAVGRGLAVILMITGIALFGVVTANLATFILERGSPDSQAATTAPENIGPQLDEILRRLERIEERLSN
ncbi:MAG: potassium channel family protein, partial [Actinobacteria bacterium]|nr:potassium channel family protein [Actinomycetota bacterium]